jgi:flagellar biosynthesis/type III secretory pathway protein FliH
VREKRVVTMAYWAIAKEIVAKNPAIKNGMIPDLIHKVIKKYKEERNIEIILTDKPGKIIRHPNGKSYMIGNRGDFKQI